MQNRRLVEDDGKGVQEVLNETEANDRGIKSTALYRMQIFDTVKGKSKQREE